MVDLARLETAVGDCPNRLAGAQTFWRAQCLYRRHPLHIASLESVGRAERIGVMNESLVHNCHRPKAMSGLMLEVGDDYAVIQSAAVVGVGILSH